MTILDIDVPARAWRWVVVRTTSRGAREACDGEAAPFTGLDLVTTVLGHRAGTVRILLTQLDPVPVGVALGERGAVLLNTQGHVGLVVGDHRVVEPCGRRYAFTETTGDWWVAGYRSSLVVGTMSG